MALRNKWSSFAQALVVAMVAPIFVLVAPTAPAVASINPGVGSTVDYSISTSGTVFVGATGDPVIPAGDNTYTVEAWFYQKSHQSGFGDYQAIVTQNQDGTGGQEDRFFIGTHWNGSAYQFHFGTDLSSNAESWFGAGRVPVDQWAHFAFVATGPTSWEFYLNGQLFSSRTSTTVSPVLADRAGFAIGGNAGAGGDTFSGQIDQVKIWSDSLTTAEVESSMHSLGQPAQVSKTLVSHFDFNEGTGTALYDRVTSRTLSGSGNFQFVDVKRSTTASDGSEILTFPRTYLPGVGGWTVPDGVKTLKALVVAGGGAGGNSYDFRGAGGGGAGGLIQRELTLGNQSAIPIIVGMGGTTYNFDGTASGLNGQGSFFADIATLGGGGGGGRWSDGSNGGSGGGAGGTSIRYGGAGTSGQGNNGGTSSNTGPGAGGGGASGAGSSPSAGAGLSSSLTGLTYAAGGQGGSTAASTDGQPASANTGNGAAGASAGGGTSSRANPIGTWAANVSRAFGGSGGSGVVVLKLERSVSVSVPNGFRSAQLTLSGTVSAAAGSYILSLQATSGSFTVGTLPAGVTANSGTSGVSVLALSGSPSALHAALNTVQFLYPVADGNFTVSATLVPVIANTATQVQDSVSGHVYKYVAAGSNDFFAHQAAAAATSVSGMTGYLSNITSASEKDFLVAAGGNFISSNLFIGLTDRFGSTNRSSTWSWIAGPEAGKAVSTGHVGETPEKALIAGAYSNWEATEPNGNTTDGTSNCGVTNFNSPGVWDDVNCSSVTSGAIFEYGGYSGEPGFSAANFSVEKRYVDIEFTELVFDYSNHENMTTRGSVGNCSGTGTADCIGKLLNDQVLFKNVSTRNGVSVDALVTTKFLSSGTTITKYEVGAAASKENSYFLADINVKNANSYVSFEFKFYLAGTYQSTALSADAIPVRLKNVDVSLIDIDYTQFNTVTDIEGFTVANKTNVTTCMSGNSSTLSTNCTTSTSANANNALFGNPNFVRFQGTSGARSDVPKDMAIASYGQIDSFEVGMGQYGSANPNYFGVAFVALPWGSETPAPAGVQYTVTYSGNVNTGGSTASAVTGAVSTQFTIAAQGTLVRSGYTFGGWNTAADGSGTNYAASGTTSIPNGGMTLYAKWIPVLYSLTYQANGGVGAPAVANYQGGTALAITGTNPTRNGYQFRHWTTNQDGTGTSYSANAAFTMPSANQVLYAQWIVSQGALQYQGNGGTSTQPTQTATAGSTVAVAGGSLTARSGYSFAGWNTVAGGTGADYSSGSSLILAAGTTILYAQWTRTPSSINYVGNGGSGTPVGTTLNGYADVTYSVSSNIPTRAGYTFASWNTVANGSSTSFAAGSDITMSSSGTILYAQWTANAYTISYNVNGGSAASEPASTSHTAFTNISLSSSVPNYTGYKFNGWNTQANGLGSSYTSGSNFVMPANNVVLYAQWVDNSFDIVYNANGGVGGPAPSTSSGQTAISVSNILPSWLGYTFLNWNLSANGSGTPYLANSNFTVTGDTTFFAKWEALLFNLSYDSNGGTGEPATQSGLIVSQSVAVSATVPSRSGYVFNGWGTTRASGGITYAGGATFLMSASDIVLYADWVGLPFSLAYNANGGAQAPATQTVLAGASELAGPGASRTGYLFSKWNTMADGSGTDYSQNTGVVLMPASNLTLYAIWTPVTRTISFDPNGGSGQPADASGTFGSSVTISATAPTKSGAIFLGWNTQCDGLGIGYQPGDSITIPANNLTLCALWQTLTYQLEYNANGGSNPPAGLTANGGAIVSLSPSIPSRAGYSFGSWNTVADGSGTPYLGNANYTMPGSNVTLYATWIANPVTIYYNANGGSSAPGTQTSVTGAIITTSGTLPTRPGYEFVEWNTQVGGDGDAYSASSAITVPPQNTILYAQWTYSTYTLTYNANSGSGGPAAEAGLTVSQNVVLSSTLPSRTNYKFIGWNTRADGNGQTYASGTNYVMPAANTTLYAKWIGDQFKLVYNPNGGNDEPLAEEHTFPATITVSAVEPTRTGYTFTHWASSATGGSPTYSSGASVTLNTDLTLFATWEAKAFSISYLANLGSGILPETQVVSFSDSVMLATGNTISKSGSLLLGWNTLADGTGAQYSLEQIISMPAQDLVLYAQWAPVVYLLDYNATGGTGEPEDVYVNGGATIAIDTSTPAKSTLEFDGWVTVTNVSYNPGAAFTMPPANTMLFASWRTPVVSGNGGSSPIFNNDPPSLSPTVSPTASPTVSPTTSPTTSPVIPGDSGDGDSGGTNPGRDPKEELDLNAYINAKNEAYDPDSFENWSSSDQAQSTEPTPEAIASEAPAIEDPESTPSVESNGLGWLWWLLTLPAGAAAWFGIARRRRD